MQEKVPLDAGFVVDWQIADDSLVIDLSTDESEVILPDDAAIRAGRGLGTDS
jgi:hypothetical protein